MDLRYCRRAGKVSPVGKREILYLLLTLSIDYGRQMQKSFKYEYLVVLGLRYLYR